MKLSSVWKVGSSSFKISDDEWMRLPHLGDNLGYKKRRYEERMRSLDLPILPATGHDFALPRRVRFRLSRIE